MDILMSISGTGIPCLEPIYTWQAVRQRPSSGLTSASKNAPCQIGCSLRSLKHWQTSTVSGSKTIRTRCKTMRVIIGIGMGFSNWLYSIGMAVKKGTACKGFVQWCQNGWGGRRSPNAWKCQKQSFRKLFTLFNMSNSEFVGLLA